MLRFTLRRIVVSIPVLLLVSLLSFAIIWLVPGDPAAAFLDASATPVQLAQIRHQLGLDQPFYLQMISWYGRILHGDLGESILLHRSVVSAIIERVPVTLSLAALALVFAVLMGILAGVLAAMRHGGWADQSIMGLALLGLSVPEFWLGVMLIFAFAVGLGWFPAGGYVAPSVSFTGWAHCIALPAFSLPTHNVPSGLALASDQGRVSPGNEFNLTGVLKLHNRAEFDKRVEELYDPASPTFREWLTDKDFERYAPTVQEFEAVKNELIRQGFSVVSAEPRRKRQLDPCRLARPREARCGHTRLSARRLAI